MCVGKSIFVYEKGGNLSTCLAKPDLQLDIFFTMSAETCPCRGYPLRGLFSSIALCRACAKLGVTEEIVDPAEQTCSLPGSEQCWVSPCCALPPPRCLTCPGCRCSLAVAGVSVKLLLYQVVEMRAVQVWAKITQQ